MDVSFYITKRYFLSKQNTNNVNIITFISIISLSISTIAFCIILSIFSGLKDINIKLYKNINPDIKISPLNGKIIFFDKILMQKIFSIKGIKALSKSIEEKVYLHYKNKNQLVYIKGIDLTYNKVINLQKCIILGDMMLFNNLKNIIIGVNLAEQYSLNNLENLQFFVEIFSIKPGNEIITKQSFTQKKANITGVFNILEEINKQYIYCNISFLQKLIGIKQNIIYNIEIKINEKYNINTIKNKLTRILGSKYVIKTYEEQEEAMFKIMNIEHLIIYILLSFITLITSFNLIGTIIVLIIDKKNQIFILHSLGLNNLELKKIFFFTGVIITLISWIIGSIIGYILVFIQYKYEWIKINNIMPFPIIFRFYDFLLISITILCIGLFISYFTSQKIYFSSKGN